MGTLWQAVSFGKAPGIPNFLSFSVAAPCPIAGHCLGGVCQNSTGATVRCRGLGVCFTTETRHRQHAAGLGVWHGSRARLCNSATPARHYKGVPSGRLPWITCCATLPDLLGTTRLCPLAGCHGSPAAHRADRASTQIKLRSKGGLAGGRLHREAADASTLT